MAGSGKSTLGKRLAETYGLQYYSGGDALKALAVDAGFNQVDRGWWESAEGLRFLQRRARDPSFDKLIDQKLLARAAQGDVVLDSWTMPWLYQNGFKVWLEASLEERARRVAGRDGVSVAKALTAIQAKDAGTKAIFQRLYGFSLGEDFGPFDVVLDVNALGPDEVYHALVQVLNRLLYMAR